MAKVFTMADVARHATADDCWIIVHGKVIDMTSFLKEHPGGKKVVLKVAGKDATTQFDTFHRGSVLDQYAARLQVGWLEGHEPASGASAASSSSAAASTSLESFGEGVPYGDPYWYSPHYVSPFYQEKHARFRAKVRDFVETELMPHCHEWDESGTFPRELHQRAYAAGIYGAAWPVEYGGTPPEGGFDAFMDLILCDELARCAAGGLLWSCFLSFGISLPPVLLVGSQYLKDKVARDVISGKKTMCLAVTEPNGGSDVAGLTTTGRLEGEEWVVNGEKKFITGGCKADYFTVAVRTGGAGMGGITLMLLEKGMEGLRTRRMPTQGWWMSNTAYVTMEDVRVPARNVIGRVNEGFKAIMHNFNHERFVLAATCNRYARVCLEEGVKYGRVRKTFGKRLMEHQVLRHKVAEMARTVESNHALLEQIAYQMSRGVSDRQLSGIIALCKVSCTKGMEFCAREASQIFGGNSCLRGGYAEKVERLYREVRINAIGGGSEEILMDLAMRQARL